MDLTIASLVSSGIALVLVALGFSIGMYFTMKIIRKDVSFSTLFFTGISTGIVSVLIVSFLIVFFPSISMISILLIAVINFIIIYKMLDIGFLWTIFALILNVIVSAMLTLVIPLIAILLIGILA